MFAISAEPIDPAILNRSLNNERAGALATFEGWVRNHNDGRQVDRLEYEAYESLCLTEANLILAEAKERFGVLDARCVHRVGLLEIGDAAVWVGVIAEHRGEAFAACRYIIDEIKSRLPIWKKEHYTDGSSEWVNCQTCSAHAGDKKKHAEPELNAVEYYSNQVILPEIDLEGQNKLTESRVLVIGAGSLGSSALLYLAAAGVGTLGICESESLHASDLHRQVLYSACDSGKPKAELAAERLAAVNPLIKIRQHQEKLEAGNVTALFKQYDMVLDCTDDFVTKFLINDAAILNGIPLIDASINKFEGELQLLTPFGGGQCLRCLWPEVPEGEAGSTRANVGVLGAVAGVLGSMQAMEALKVILGLPTALSEQSLLVNLLTYEVELVKRYRNENCPLCGSTPTILEIDPRNYVGESGWELDILSLADSELSHFQWVDIRETEEREQSRPFSCLDIPLSQFDAENPPLESNQNYLLFCQRGLRSARLVQELREHGFENFYSVKGGIGAVRSKFIETRQP